MTSGAALPANLLPPLICNFARARDTIQNT